MSATYNWAYTPGVTNKYGIVIAGGPDDELPSNACYVALFGCDDPGHVALGLEGQHLMRAQQEILFA